MKLDKRKKIIIGIILLIILCIGIIVGVLLLNNKEEQKDAGEKIKDTILLKEDLKFEINSEVKLLSLVSEDNQVKILSEDETIDTSTLGEKEVTIKYEEEDKEETKTFKITIVDTQAPTIEYQKELSTTINKKIDLLKGVKVSDNSKEEIKARVEGEYDFKKEGTYNLKYVAIDSSNNKKEEEFTLKVNKKSTTSNNSTTKPQTNNKNNTNNNSNKNQNDDSFDEKAYEEAKAIYDKYVSMYKNKYSTKQESFSPEQNVIIETIKNPMKWHYEWLIIEQKWQLVDDTTGWVYGETKALAEKIYPPPARAGKEITHEENGITHYEGEKTEVYQVYLYTVIYDGDCCKFF